MSDVIELAVEFGAYQARASRRIAELERRVTEMEFRLNIRMGEEG